MCAERVALELREKHGADVVIAITHMRLEEDVGVAAHVDLVLGGHDHEYILHGNQYTCVGDHAEGDIRIVKSGRDFREFSIVKMHVERRAGRSCADNMEGMLDLTPMLRRRSFVHAVDHIREPSFGFEDPRMLAAIASVDHRIASVSHSRVAYTAAPCTDRPSTSGARRPIWVTSSPARCAPSIAPTSRL